MSYVCVDFDGTLLNFNGALQKHLKQSRGIEFEPSDCIKYNYKYDTLGFDRKIIFEAMKEPEMYDYLQYFDKSIEALSHLQKYISTKAYTGSVNIPEIIERRSKLIKTLGLYGEPFVNGDKPVDMQAVALFDDCLAVHEKWINEGSEAFLFLIDAPYNQKTNENKGSLDWSRVIRCKNFAEAVEKFIYLYIQKQTLTLRPCYNSEVL